jgi:Transient receptor potential (TRP) ion channel.
LGRSWLSFNEYLTQLLVTLGTLATFAFYQWTQKCTSGLTFFLSTSVLAFALMVLGFTSYYILRVSKRPGGLKDLYAKDGIYGRRWGAMYETLNDKHLYFAVALWVIAIIRGAITGFGQSSGLAQLVTMTVVQSIFCIGKHSNWNSLLCPVTHTFQLFFDFSRTTVQDITVSPISSKVQS